MKINQRLQEILFAFLLKRNCYFSYNSSFDRELKESHQWKELPSVDSNNRLQAAGRGERPATTTASLWCKEERVKRKVVGACTDKCVHNDSNNSRLSLCCEFFFFHACLWKLQEMSCTLFDADIYGIFIVREDTSIK